MAFILLFQITCAKKVYTECTQTLRKFVKKPIRQNLKFLLKINKKIFIITKNSIKFITNTKSFCFNYPRPRHKFNNSITQTFFSAKNAFTILEMFLVKKTPSLCFVKDFSILKAIYNTIN